MSINYERPKRGLLVCANKSNDGLMHITLDDLVRDSEGNARWIFDCFVTSKEYEEKSFDNLDFDEKELADFGHYILSRLYAFKRRNDL